MTVLDSDVLSAYLKADCATRTPELHRFVTNLVRTEGVAISYVTLYELRRWLAELQLRGEGRRKRVMFEKLIEDADVIGLDGSTGEGWNIAARIWATGRAHKPAIVITDADLLIAATAEFHGRRFVTCETTLAENLRAAGLKVDVEVLRQA